MEDDRHYHNYLDAEDHGLAALHHLDDGARGVHVDGDHLPVLAGRPLPEDDMGVDSLQLDLPPVSLVSTLHVLSRTKAVLADASHLDCLLLFVRTVCMNRLGGLNEDCLTVCPLQGTHPHTQGQNSARTSDGPALQGGEVHEVWQVRVAVARRLGWQADLQGEGTQFLLLAPWR